MRLALALLLALAVPATASAGGFATVGLAPPPADIGPGDTWIAEATVLQHGRTPNNYPTVSIVVRPSDGPERSFEAEPTGVGGVHRAEVIVPSGTWRYVAVDQMGVEHGFPPVSADRGMAAPTEARPPALAADGGSDLLPAALVALAAVALLAAFGAFALRGALPRSGQLRH